MNQLSLHPHLQALFDLWATEDASAAFSKPVPDAFFDQIFVVETVDNAPPVKLVKAGQSLRVLGGNSIQGMDLLSIFSQEDRILIWTLMRTVALKSRPGLLRLHAHQPGSAPIPVDLAIAPLGGGSRYLGFFLPSERLQREGLRFEVLSVHPPMTQAPLSNS